MCQSDSDFPALCHSILDENSIRDNEAPNDWVEREADSTNTPGMWSNILQVMALATALQIPIMSVCPTVASDDQTSMYHKRVDPIRIRKPLIILKNRVIEQYPTIFWTMMNYTKNNYYIPNHVVPVVKTRKITVRSRGKQVKKVESDSGSSSESL